MNTDPNMGIVQYEGLGLGGENIPTSVLLVEDGHPWPCQRVHADSNLLE